MRSFSWLMCMALIDGSFIGVGACPRGARLCDRLSGFMNPSLESSGRSSYADLGSVDNDATSGGEQRLAGQRRRVEEARGALEVVRPGAAHDYRVEAEAGDAQPRERDPAPHRRSADSVPPSDPGPA